MGTRCDFYVGRGESAEWLGSLAFDGYRIAEVEEQHKDKDADNKACWGIKTATSEADYRQAVSELLAMNSDASLPSDGWPWPWEDSRTTDYSYAFDGGKTYTSIFGHKWFDPMVEQDPELEEGASKEVFPNMKAVQNVTLGKRSGLLVVSAKE